MSSEKKISKNEIDRHQRYWLDLAKTDELIARTEFNLPFESYAVYHKEVRIRFYCAEMVALLLSQTIELKNAVTDKIETVEIKPYLTLYSEGFIRGRKNFDTFHKVSREALLINSDAFIKDLLMRYEGNVNGEALEKYGWKQNAEGWNTTLSFKSSEQWGFNSGIRCAAEDYINENTTVFDKYRSKKTDLIKHEFSTIQLKYDTDKIYNAFFKGVIAVCNKDCFKNWLVDGYEDDPITFQLKGRGGAKAKAQLISFIVAITGNSGLETKLSYYTKVFGEDVKGSVSSGLNSKLSSLLKYCEL